MAYTCELQALINEFTAISPWPGGNILEYATPVSKFTPPLAAATFALRDGAETWNIQSAAMISVALYTVDEAAANRQRLTAHELALSGARDDDPVTVLNRLRSCAPTNRRQIVGGASQTLVWLHRGSAYSGRCYNQVAIPNTVDGKACLRR